MALREGILETIRRGLGEVATRKTLGLALVLVTVAMVSVATLVEVTGVEAATIEDRYAAKGPWAVTTAEIQDAGGSVSYVVYYPTDLGRDGFRHPIITWGNGSDAAPSQYTGILTHLASYGFVVVASTCETTGTGAEIMAALDWMVRQNTNPESIFHGKLDTTRTGAFGHSQGAGGIVNAATRHDGGHTIKALVAVSLPALRWCSPDTKKYEASLISVPVFFIRGDGLADRIICPLGDLRAAYDKVPVGAVMGTRRGTDHNEIQDRGTGKLTGYVTAWFMYQLQGDASARDAFAGDHPEIEANAGWADTATKSLP